MYYDNGGRGAPLPMPQPQPTLPRAQRAQPPVMPKLTGNRTLDQYRLGVFGKNFPINRFIGRQQIGMAGMPQQQAMASQQQLQFGSPAMGQMPTQGGAPPIGYRPLQQLYQRDINGKPPGAWDYRPPQYQGNPFLPMVPY